MSKVLFKSNEFSIAATVSRRLKKEDRWVYKLMRIFKITYFSTAFPLINSRRARMWNTWASCSFFYVSPARQYPPGKWNSQTLPEIRRNVVFVLYTFDGGKHIIPGYCWRRVLREVYTVEIISSYPNKTVRVSTRTRYIIKRSAGCRRNCTKK